MILIVKRVAILAVAPFSYNWEGREADLPLPLGKRCSQAMEMKMKRPYNRNVVAAGDRKGSSSRLPKIFGFIPAKL